MNSRIAALLAVTVVWVSLVGFSAGAWLIATRALQRRASWRAPNPRPLSIHVRLLAPFYAVILAIGSGWALFDVDAGTFGDLLHWCALFILPFAISATVLLILRELPPRPRRRDADIPTFEQAVQRDATRGSLAIGVAFLLTFYLGAQLAGWPPWRSLPVYDAKAFSIAYPPDWEVAGMSSPPDDESPVDASPQVSFYDPESNSAAMNIYVYPSSSEALASIELLEAASAGAKDFLREEELDVPGAVDATLEEVESAVSLLALEEIHQISIVATTHDRRVVHVLLTAPADEFDSYSAMFDRIVESFRLTPS